MDLVYRTYIRHGHSRRLKMENYRDCIDMELLYEFGRYINDKTMDIEPLAKKYTLNEFVSTLIFAGAYGYPQEEIEMRKFIDKHWPNASVNIMDLFGGMEKWKNGNS